MFGSSRFVRCFSAIVFFACSVCYAAPQFDKVSRLPVEGRSVPQAVLPGYWADPHISYFDGKFYIYATEDKSFWRNITDFKVWSSIDLVHWENEGTILDFQDVRWTKNKAWAPAMAEKKGKYYFYFTAAPQIGVAVGESPSGTFKDALNKPLVFKGPRNKGNKKGFGAIDPMVFVDDDGEAYLYAGITRCRVWKLNDDMVSYDEKKFIDITPEDYLEGPFVFKRNNKYYFTWSQFGTGSEYYSVWYGMGDSPTGPFKKQAEPITWPQGDIKGPGHHSIVQIPGKDEWYIAYHALTNNPERSTKTEKNPHIGRETYISPMRFNADGTIQRVDLYETLKPVSLEHETVKKGSFFSKIKAIFR